MMFCLTKPNLKFPVSFLKSSQHMHRNQGLSWFLAHELENPTTTNISAASATRYANHHHLYPKGTHLNTRKTYIADSDRLEIYDLLNPILHVFSWNQSCRSSPPPQNLNHRAFLQNNQKLVKTNKKLPQLDLPSWFNDPFFADLSYRKTL